MKREEEKTIKTHVNMLLRAKGTVPSMVHMNAVCDMLKSLGKIGKIDDISKNRLLGELCTQAEAFLAKGGAR